MQFSRGLWKHEKYYYLFELIILLFGILLVGGLEITYKPAAILCVSCIIVFGMGLIKCWGQSKRTEREFIATLPYSKREIERFNLVMGWMVYTIDYVLAIVFTIIMRAIRINYTAMSLTQIGQLVLQWCLLYLVLSLMYLWIALFRCLLVNPLFAYASLLLQVITYMFMESWLSIYQSFTWVGATASIREIINYINPYNNVLENYQYEAMINLNAVFPTGAVIAKLFILLVYVGILLLLLHRFSGRQELSQNGWFYYKGVRYLCVIDVVFLVFSIAISWSSFYLYYSIGGLISFTIVCAVVAIAFGVLFNYLSVPHDEKEAR